MHCQRYTGKVLPSVLLACNEQCHLQGVRMHSADLLAAQQMVVQSGSLSIGAVIDEPAKMHRDRATCHDYCAADCEFC